MNPNKLNPPELHSQAESHLANASDVEAASCSSDKLLHELELQNQELRRTQLALEESRDRYLDLYELSPVAYLTLTEQGLIQSINLTGEALFATERQNLLEQYFARFMDCADADRWYIFFRQLLRKNQRQSINLTLKSAHDNFFYAQLDCLSVVNAANSVELRIALTDISEHKQVEDGLRLSEERYRSIIEDQNELICRYLPNGRLTFVNGAYARYYNTSPTELVNINYVPQIPDADMGMIREKLAGISPDNPSVSYTHRIITPQGETRWQQWTQRGIYAESGRIVEYQAVGNDITERKLTEQQLKENEQQLQFALEGGHLGFWDWNLTANTVERNSIWAEMLGYTRQEVQNTTKQWLDFIYPEDRKKAWDSINNALQGLSAYHEVEYRMLHKDGSIRWILDHASIVQRDADGKPTRMTGTHTDVTRLKNMETALRNSEERFRNLFTQAPVGIALIDSLTGYIYNANQKYADIVGMTVADLQSIDWMKITHPDDLQADLDNMALMNAGKTNGFSMEKRYIRPDGSIVWVNLTVSRMQVHGKGNPCHHCIVEDISERKQTLQLLEQEKAKLYTLIQTIPDLVWLKDVNGVYQFCNRTCESFFGAKQADMLGKTDYDFVSQEQADFFRSHDARVIEDGLPHSNEEYLSFAGNGYQGFFETLKTPLRNSAGEIIGVLGISHDMTERKLAEETMREAELKATRANQAKSEFLANMSHEIRTPMNAILGFSSILADLITDPTQHYYLEAIKNSGKILLQLINDILDLSKIEAGKLDINYHEVAIKFIFDDLVLIFAQKLAEKGVSFNLEIAENIPHCLLLDEVRLRQILLNIIGNAVKFTDQGFIRVCVTLQPSCAAHYFDLSIAISDSGIGIAPDQLESIFSAFTQQKRQSVRYGGTGLGLTISKRLVEMMHGTISVSSELDKGSCFTIKLPHVEVCNQTGELLPETQASCSVSPAHFQPATVLQVDDSEINRLLIKSYLDDYPELTIIEAESGEQALELIRQQHFELILMDRVMPGEDGDSVCEKIRALPDYTDTPIIMLSASAVSLSAQQRQAFYNLQLNKPVDKAELLVAMQSFLAMDENNPLVDRLNTQTTEIIIEDCEPEKLQELLELLSSSYLAPLTELSNPGIFEINSLIDIADRLIQIAAQYHCSSLSKWANSLKNQAELFDLPNLPKTLSSFQTLFQQLKNMLEHP